MIMPSKYLREDEALIGVSALILPLLENDGNLSSLWEKAKNFEAVGNYERFILALDFLFILGIVDIDNNKVVRALI